MSFNVFFLLQLVVTNQHNIHRFIEFWEMNCKLSGTGPVRRLTAVEMKTLAHMQLIILSYEQQCLKNGIMLSLACARTVTDIFRSNEDSSPIDDIGKLWNMRRNNEIDNNFNLL